MLEDLQNTDLKIRAEEATADQIPKDLEKLKKEFEASKKGLEQVKLIAEEAKKYKRKKDAELVDKETQLSKYKSQLVNMKTNREYQAILSEIENVKKVISMVEEDLLKGMEEIESLEKKQGEEQDKINKEKEAFNRNEQEKQGELKKLISDIGQLKNQTTGIRSQIPADILKDYDKLKKARNGKAIVKVVNGICEGCFIALTPQYYNEVRMGDRLNKCPNCNRILYYETQDTSSNSDNNPVS
ncbi:MAG: C4-type zinc ribbon domain-containing protein [bacterium]